MASSEKANSPAAAVVWPAFAALGVVTALAAASLVVDLQAATETAAQTSHLVDNSLRSIELADDLRFEVHRLGEVGDDPSALAATATQLQTDVRDYEPIATETGEREEFERLKGLLARLQGGKDRSLIPAIEVVIGHLIDINERSARGNEAAIHATHDRMFATDVAAGALTIASAIAIGLVLLRGMRRQRELLVLHLATLEERQRDLEAFAARVSHDLKGPLSPLRGYSDLLQLEESARVRDVAQRIRRASDRMTGIIDDLLALSTAGRAQPGKVAVAGAVLELVQELEPELGDAEVAVDVGDHIVACSEGVLLQVVRNVLSNAVKYRAEQRRLVVRISAEKVDGWVELAIADNGCGMTPDVALHAFEPFYRAATASAPGHGLGLSIVKRAVEAQGGTVDLESVAGVGTKVAVRLRPV